MVRKSVSFPFSSFHLENEYESAIHSEFVHVWHQCLLNRVARLKKTTFILAYEVKGGLMIGSAKSRNSLARNVQRRNYTNLASLFLFPSPLPSGRSLIHQDRSSNANEAIQQTTLARSAAERDLAPKVNHS
jgi:hypothetical protein